MEERPRQSEQNPPDDEDQKISPGEIFLKKSMSSPERPETAHSVKYQDGSRFKGLFRDAMFTKLSRTEVDTEHPDHDMAARHHALAEKTLGQEVAAEELRFEDHENANSQQDRPTTLAQKEPTSPIVSDPASSDAHHISNVINEKAKDIQSQHNRPSADTWGQNAKAQNTAKPYMKAISYGFLAALIVLILVILTAVL